MAVRDRLQREADSSTGLLEELRSSPGLLLALLGQHAMRRLRQAHTQVELSPRQFQLLGLLYDRGAMGQQELGQAMETDPSIMVTLLNPLETDGLLSRRRDTADRRRHLVTLTAKGQRRLASAAQAQRDAEDELFAGLDISQRDQLRALLMALKASLSARCGSAAPDSGDCASTADAEGC
jgi:DNA-binding MarR family transcriptional regulator